MEGKGRSNSFCRKWRRLLKVSVQASILVGVTLVLWPIHSADVQNLDTPSKTDASVVGKDTCNDRQDIETIAEGGGSALPDVYIEVNIPATELTLYENGVPLFRRKVSIGQGIFPTPEQESAIRRIEWNPWWYPPKNSWWARNEKDTPPGPNNPLGVVKMPISEGIMFHGTNKEWTVGRAASHGCMRMKNRDAKELAWYLQTRFSSKKDPSLKNLYAANRRTTYRVVLDVPVPVRLVYDPVVINHGLLSLYPDYYRRLGASSERAIISELIENDMDIKNLDEEKVDELTKHWQGGAMMTPIEDLMHDPLRAEYSRSPECS